MCRSDSVPSLLCAVRLLIQISSEARLADLYYVNQRGSSALHMRGLSVVYVVSERYGLLPTHYGAGCALLESLMLPFILVSL